MKSAFVIIFKNGEKIMLSERAYKRYEEETPKEDVYVEEHWFSLEDARKKYPEMDFIE